jgi:hypothetical protein
VEAVGAQRGRRGGGEGTLAYSDVSFKIRKDLRKRLTCVDRLTAPSTLTSIGSSCTGHLSTLGGPYVGAGYIRLPPLSHLGRAHQLQHNLALARTPPRPTPPTILAGAIVYEGVGSRYRYTTAKINVPAAIPPPTTSTSPSSCLRTLHVIRSALGNDVATARALNELVRLAPSHSVLVHTRTQRRMSPGPTRIPLPKPIAKIPLCLMRFLYACANAIEVEWCGSPTSVGET